MERVSNEYRSIWDKSLKSAFFTLKGQKLCYNTNSIKPLQFSVKSRKDMNYYTLTHPLIISVMTLIAPTGLAAKHLEKKRKTLYVTLVKSSHSHIFCHKWGQCWCLLHRQCTAGYWLLCLSCPQTWDHSCACSSGAPSCRHARSSLSSCRGLKVQQVHTPNKYGAAHHQTTH